MYECVLNTEALKYQIWYNLNKLLATCGGAVYKGSQRILFIQVSIWHLFTEHGTTPNSVWYNPSPHLLRLERASSIYPILVFLWEISHFQRLTRDMPFFSWSQSHSQALGSISNSRKSSEHQSWQPNGRKQDSSCVLCHAVVKQCGWGQCPRSRCPLMGPPGPFSRRKWRQQGWVRRRISSGIFSFADIIGWDIPLLPINFG